MGAIRQFQDSRIGSSGKFTDIQCITGGQNRIDSIYQYTIDGINFQTFNGNEVVAC
jgi:hypothetical protein